MTNFNAALERFVAGCQEICTAKDKTFENAVFNTKIYVDPNGRRYKRIVREDAHGRKLVHCFVDTTNGDVLKAAGWKVPAKHARGNIFNLDNGLDCMDPYGAAYLR